MNRAEHLAWAKTRAIQYANQGDTAGAIASITSDLQSHPETKDHAALGLMMMLALNGHLNTPVEVRTFIEGFN